MRMIHALLAGAFLAGSAAFAAEASPAAPATPKAADTATSATPAFNFPAPGTTRVVDQREVERLVATHGSELLVVNMWATFCGPCVEEIPYFVAEAKQHAPEKVRFAGISLDLRRDVQKKVVPFLQKNAIPYPNVVFFGEADPMIGFLSSEWQGDLPATFFYDRQGRKLGEVLAPMTREELRAAVAKYSALAAAQKKS